MSATPPATPPTGPPAPSAAAPPVPTLEVRGLTVRFAGVTALNAVDITVEPNSLHAIIGPNGAGKSTCFNVLSGVYRANEGTVRFGDAELTRLPPHRIARLGVARTFQNLALSEFQTTAQNLMLGRYRLTGTGFLSAGLHLRRGRREEREHMAKVREIAEFVGIDAYLDVPAGALPYGVRKRVELARALCLEPRLLLLDEPVAGMNGGERRALVDAIGLIRRELEVSIVLVEHDMALVGRLADEVTVLDFGKKIATGTPAQIRRNPEVIRAYLGEPAEGESTENTADEPAGDRDGDVPHPRGDADGDTA